MMNSDSGSEKVEILLATYNGEKYISEQIDSIKQQSYGNWILSINDDGSSDNTVKILESIAKDDQRLILKSLDNKRHDAAGNFLALLVNSEAPYIMFCDQDDVWHEDKIILEMDALKELEKKYGKETPLLVFTDSHIVDKDLDLINPSFVSTLPFNPKTITLAQLMIDNVAQGCTMLINRPLVEKILSYQLPNIFGMHDYWAMVLAAIFGQILFLPTSTMDYRQHELNVCGAAKSTLTARSGIKHVLAQPIILKGWFAKLSDDEKKFAARAKKIIDYFSNELNDDDYIMLKRFVDFNSKDIRYKEKLSTIRNYELIRNQRSKYSKICQFLGMMV